jgi:pyruvate kinase
MSTHQQFLSKTLKQILGVTQEKTRRTKIVCTIGPASGTVEILVKMLDLGMNVARLNFSHGDHASHGKMVENVRAALAQRPGKVCAIMLDTKGPEIRTGVLRDHAAVMLEEGQELFVSTDYSLEGTSQAIAISYPSLCTTVHKGSTILLADGSITLEVTAVVEGGVKTIVKNKAKLGEKKNVCLPGCVIDLPTTTEKDAIDLEQFGLKYNVDFIAASFVRKPQDIEEIRDILGPRGANIRIISKIENKEGITNFDKILAVTDGIMVARGDLGMEIPPEKVFLAQKMMIQKCIAAGKPVITATQMLESMTSNPRPTRAEASDVANAVLEGTDAVMLSGETAGGSFPLQAVEIMGKICIEAELFIDPQVEFKRTQRLTKKLDTNDSVCLAAVHAALQVKAKLIIALTDRGETACKLARFRPPMQILALSMNQATINQSGLVRGCIVVKVPSYEGRDTLIRAGIAEAKTRGLLKTGDKAIAVFGLSESDVNSANVMEIVQVD